MNALPLGSGTSKKRTRLLGALLGAGLVVAAFLGYRGIKDGLAGAGKAVASKPANHVPPIVSRAVPIVSAAGLEQQSGVRVVRVAVSGDGGLLDLRYQVVDPDTANVLHDPAYPPEMVEEKTGLVVDNLFMGHQHKGRLRLGETYFLLFENPGNIVHRGARVTVVLGDARVQHVRVQ